MCCLVLLAKQSLASESWPVVDLCGCVGACCVQSVGEGDKVRVMNVVPWGDDELGGVETGCGLAIAHVVPASDAQHLHQCTFAQMHVVPLGCFAIALAHLNAKLTHSAFCHQRFHCQLSLRRAIDSLETGPCDSSKPLE